MAVSFGITNVEGSCLESSSIEHNSDHKMIMEGDGTFCDAKIYDTSYKFTVKGRGTTSVTVGGTSGAPSGATGKVIITSVKQTQTNEDFEAYEYSGVSYPSAT